MVLDGFLELFVKVSIVEEDVWVIVPSIEVTLDRLDGLDDAVDFFITSENDKRCVGSRLRGIGFETSRGKDLVVPFADFPIAS